MGTGPLAVIAPAEVAFIHTLRDENDDLPRFLDSLAAWVVHGDWFAPQSGAGSW